MISPLVCVLDVVDFAVRRVGSAFLLAYNSQEATKDIDAPPPPEATGRGRASRQASRPRAPPTRNWINDGIEQFISPKTESKRRLAKIEAATELALFRKTTDGKHQQAAIEAARKSAAYWKLYAATASSLHHNPLWTNRVGHVNWQESYSRALFDLTMLGAAG